MVPIEFKKGNFTDDVVSTMIYMSLIGDDDFSRKNISKYLENHRKLFYDCKIYTKPVFMPKLIIDPIKIRGYRYIAKKFRLKPFEFMNWIDRWCKKQLMGSEVFLFDSSYTPKVKGYLLGNGYDEINENYFLKTEKPPKAKYILL